MSVRAEDGTIAPVGFDQGLPYTQNKYLAIDTVGAVDHYHQGLPFTVESRVAVVIEGTVDRYGAGAAPFDAAGRLVMTEDPSEIWLGAVGFNAGRISVNLI